MTTLLGCVTYTRAYDHCDHCHHGWHPTDVDLDLQTSRTRGAQEVIALGGVQVAFGEVAQRSLPRMTGLNVSESTVQRVTEAAGHEVDRHAAVEQPLGPAEDWTWPVDAEGRTTAYVALDASGVPQQGPHGEQVEGRMPWVASVFAPVPRDAKAKHRLRRVRYQSGLMSLPEIGRRRRRDCEEVGVAQADVVICLTDGGNGLEECLTQTVLNGIAREIVTILDYDHAADAVVKFVTASVPAAQATTAQEAWLHKLKHSGGTAILSDLESLDLTAATAEARELHRQTCGYLRHKLHRMDSPSYLSRGWEIGSGEIESACKSIIGGRLKGPGMRWREPGTTAVCALRALFKSDPHLWDPHWSQPTAG